MNQHEHFLPYMISKKHVNYYAACSSLLHLVVVNKLKMVWGCAFKTTISVPTYSFFLSQISSTEQFVILK